MSRLLRTASLALASVLFVGCAAAGVPVADASKLSKAEEPTPAAAEVQTAKPISREQVAAAQGKWCEALVAIGAAADPAATAKEVLSSAYNYAAAPVLFKPTLTSGKQTFRFDQEGALSYFVGGNPAYPDDHGFARKGWKTCRPEVREVYSHGDMVLAMGNVYMSDGKGSDVMVDKTFGYVRSGDSLKIVLHHSSLPYSPKP